MQSAIDTLVAMDFAVHSPNLLVQQIREHIEESKTPLDTAKQFIFNVTSIAVDYTDLLLARHVAQSIGEDAILRDSYTFEDSISRGESRHRNLVAKMPYISLAYIPSETSTFSTPKTTTSIAVAEGVSTKVEVKADGKIKKGGKQVLAAELYALHVTNATTPMTNQEFIAVLMKELGMTKAGSTTYAYNCRKAAK
jgi:hypothetical protein